MNRDKCKRALFLCVKYLVSAAVVAVVVGPLLVTLFTSVKTQAQLASTSPILPPAPGAWNWDNYADSHPSMAHKVYMSLGDREEHARNQRMAAVGDCIRRHHERLKAQLGSGSTTLAWNKGGHFDHEDQRMADAFLWCLERIDGDKMDENKR